MATAAATLSSATRSWTCSIFSCTVTGVSTCQPSTRLAESGDHRLWPVRPSSGGARIVLKRRSSSTEPRILWTVCETPACRCSAGHREDVHR
ncbi:hypothetical protein BX266_7240 [Streptomyces sp. TLI_171]|nr:hypothetical protein BX266_7240 [Streptomyces sp. TLI_171]